MIRIRYAKLLKIGLPIILIVFAVDFLYGFVSEKWSKTSAKSAINLSVKSEKGASGHNTIGIDEQALGSSSNKSFLHFSTLGNWNYDIDSKTQCPKPIQELSGKDYDCVGFMYPLQTGDKIKDFCLLRSTQTCCYGPRPQFNQYILVEMKEPVKFQRLTPVMISGKFFVDPKPDDGYIYRMEGTSLSDVGEDTPDVDPVKASKHSRIPLFDYAPLMGMASKSKSAGVSSALSSLSGKQVIVAGYCVSRSSSETPRLIVAKSWWDGVASGTPPTIYNAITVFPANAQQIPPLWKPYQVFTGTLQVTKDSSKWNKDGVIQLQDAQIGVPGVTKTVGLMKTGQFIPLYVKLVILVIYLLLVLKWEKQEE